MVKKGSLNTLVNRSKLVNNKRKYKCNYAIIPNRHSIGNQENFFKTNPSVYVYTFPDSPNKGGLELGNNKHSLSHYSMKFKSIQSNPI